MYKPSKTKKRAVNYLLCLVPVKKIRHLVRKKLQIKELASPFNLNISPQADKKRQDAFDLSAAIKAKKVVIFFEIEPYPMCGGQMSLFSYCRFSRQVLGKEIPVLMATLPQGPIHSQNNWFKNDIDILRWEQVLEIIKNKEEVIFHLPEADLVNPETKEETLRSRLTENDFGIFKTIKKITINVIVQEIKKCPSKQYWNILRRITPNITMTTAHKKYSTQQVCTQFDVPLKELSVFIDLEPYREFSQNKMEKLILLSPDIENPNREPIAAKLREELPDWKIIDFYRMSFTECMELTSRSFATITFGEGLDGYYLHPAAVNRLGLTVYNNIFFTDPAWKELKSVYASYQDMYDHIVDDVKFWWNHPDEYRKAVQEITAKSRQAYNFDGYLENIRNYYEERYDFYPKRKIYIVGGDGFARECYAHLTDMARKDDSIVFSGFLGHGGYGHTVDYKEFQNFYKGEVADHVFGVDEYAVIGAGYPELRAKIYHDLKRQGVRLFTIISGTEEFNRFVTAGEGNIFNHSFPSPNVKIGNGNVFNHEVIVAHDVEIGDFNFFGPRSQILGGAEVGSFNTVGANTVLLPKAKIGDNNKIAPLSAVYKGCRNNSYWAGNPAVKMGDVK